MRHIQEKVEKNISLFEKNVLVIKKNLQILGLQPLTLEVFLNNKNNFFSQ